MEPPLERYNEMHQKEFGSDEAGALRYLEARLAGVSHLDAAGLARWIH